jgi:predicted MFS family arabinose efflux permease
MVGPALRDLPPRDPDAKPAPWSYGRVGFSVLAAAAVLALGVLSEVETFGGVFVVAAVIVALLAVRPLLPKGTISARRGLPSVIVLRGLIGAAFFGAEVYLPYLLLSEYDFSPTLAGLALTVGALSWAGASWLQGRMTQQLSHVMSTTIGSSLVLVAIGMAFATAQFHLSPAIAIVGWVLGGGGMGLMYPRISVMTLAMSTTANQGFNSSALSISDSLGAALALATTGIVYATLSFPGVFAFTAVIAALAIVVSPRVAALRD